MGIQDREYIQRRTPVPGRVREPSPVRAVMGMWSVNTWIIAICVAVYFIDAALLPYPNWVPSGPIENIPQNLRIDPSQLALHMDGQLMRVPDPRTGQVRFYALVYDTVSRRIIPDARAEVFPMHTIEGWMYMSTFRLLRIEWWRLIGFQFLHTHGMIFHLVLNMLGLYFFGPMVEHYLGSKRYLAFYLLCGIFGALMYLLLNLGGYVTSQFFGTSVQIPGLLFNDIGTPLIGASAGVFGVILAGAFLMPNAVVYVFFMIPARLATVAYALVGMSLVSLLTAGHNAGGEAAHLGGALAGMYFIRHPRHLHGFFDILGRADPTSHHYSQRRRTSPKRQEIDRILAKISRSSIHSLTSEEKRTLREASEQ